jgi:hypothetical protein
MRGGRRWKALPESALAVPALSKRHLLVVGSGVPLSLVVTGANAHDVTQLDAVLQASIFKHRTHRQQCSKHFVKLERSFVALNHIAAAIIAYRKVPLKANVIYGYFHSNRPRKNPKLA